mmetsp:Transcript_14021/g.29613  ORF Transcript_14021/g.29613 Transcript_14021/m.29613 type:complete len:236 (-) Transcript_14021:182-889(-)
MPHVELPQAQFKVVMLGETYTGKTSLVLRFAEGRYRENSIDPTVGATFITKRLTVQGVTAKIQIWDTAGQERFQSLGVGFYRGADACLLVYDVTDPHSLDNLDHWRKEFLEQVGGGIQGLGDASTQFPFVVIGNKTDKTDDRLVTCERAEDWCRTAASATIMGSQPLPHFECSAKTSESVEDAFQEAARRAIVYEEYKKRSQPQLFLPPPMGANNEPINLRGHHDQGNKEPDQCC